MKINKTIVADRIRENAVVQISKRKVVNFAVSPEFIDEYIDHILAGIDKNIPALAERIYGGGKGRKTLMVKWDPKKKEYIYNDVVLLFNDASVKTIADQQD